MRNTRLRSFIHAGLVGAGMGAFGLGYLGMAIAFYSDESDKLVGNDPVGLWGTVPVAGPFVLAAQTDRPAAKAVAATLGIVQVGGLSVGISGAVLRARGLRESERRVLDDVVVSPWHMERATGFAFAGRF
jgi:hypothetical protein